MRRAGATLVEMLVALAVGGMVLMLALAAVISARRVGGALEAGATEQVRAHAVPQLLGTVIGLAGRGLAGCVVEVLDGAERWRAASFEASASAPVILEVFASTDGAGRPALYVQRLPWVRQPWLEDVASFRVLAFRNVEGAWQGAADFATWRATGVRVELVWADGELRTYELDLPHAPCGVDR